MDQWQGFDRRRICPQCGGYDTGFGKFERRPLTREMALAVLVVLAIALAGTGFLAVLFLFQLLRGPEPLAGLPIPFMFLLANLALNRGFRNVLIQCVERLQQPAQSPAGNEVMKGYHLYCRKCKFEWEMAEAEWEDGRLV